MTTKQLIKEYVDDHFNTFGFYPYDVEVDGQVYSYGNYWSILEYDSETKPIEDDSETKPILTLKDWCEQVDP